MANGLRSAPYRDIFLRIASMITGGAVAGPALAPEIVWPALIASGPGV